MGRSPYILDRRQFLTGLGLAAGSLCLPSLPGRRALAQAADPKRVIFFITPHGTVPGRWHMRQPGRDNEEYDYSLSGLGEAEFSDILRPLHRHRDKLLIVDGLARMLPYAEDYRVNELGYSGDVNRHHLAQAQLLTSTWAYQGAATARGGSQSVDQEMGNTIGQPGRWNSRVYGFNHQHAYNYVGANQPAPREENAQNAFNDILGLAPEPTTPGEVEPTRDDMIRAARASALDMAAEEFATVLPKLSSADREKLERHRSLVRDLEVGLNLVVTPMVGCDPSFSAQGHIIDQFSRITTVALACDLTRVVTIVTQNIPGSEFGIPAGLDIHQDIAHASDENSGTPQGIEGMVNYNRVYAEHFAFLLDQLDSVQEGNGTLLDNTAVVWLTELATGGHALSRVPNVIAGGAGGYFRPGRYIHYPQTTITRSYGIQEQVGPAHERINVSLMHAIGMTDRSYFGLQQVEIGGRTISLRDPLPRLT
ncbi:MAG: hypothetical protein AMS21_00215 [Gemmatimonas sp. SG8_38_2]|nr:MAG: hypothetical protein AMS21_00215 [Gemmatimonas sp. SG8_38_2]